MADKKISQLDAAGTLTGTELVELVQSGGNVRTTVTALVSGAVSSGNGIPTVINAATDYGAAGDGATNDRSAIQNALNAAEAAGGGTVYLPASPSPYLVGVAGTNTPLTVSSNVTLRGDGAKASVIKMAPTITGADAIVVDTAAENVRIESLGLTAATGTNSGVAIYFEGAVDCAVVDCWIDDKWGWGIQSRNDTFYLQILRCVLEGTTNANTIEINGSSFVTIQGCHFYGSGNNAIELWDATAWESSGFATVGLKVLDNHIVGPASSGIAGFGLVGADISGNRISDAGSFGIYLRSDETSAAIPSRECVVSGNVVKGANADAVGAAGIGFVAGAVRCIAQGNTVEGTLNGGFGISVQDVDNTLSGNVCYLNDGHGIYVLVTADRTTLVSNVCTDNSVATANAWDGLHTDADNCTVVSNVCTDTRGGSARQQFGTYVEGDGNMMFGNVGTGNGNGAVNGGTNTTAVGNQNYYTNINRIPGYIAESFVDAKGDIWTATGADLPARIAVGANGKVLVADSDASTGIAWKAQGGTVLNTVSAAGSTETLDGDDYNFHDVTLDENVTFTFTVTAAVAQFTLILRQDGTGGNTVTWPVEVKWHAATAPTILTTASAVHVLEFLTVNGGGTWRGFLASSNVS